MSLEISERSFEEAIELRAAPTQPGRLRGPFERHPRDAAALRLVAARRLPQAPTRGVRPHALPPATRCGGLRPRHAAEGVGEAQATPRCGIKERFLKRLADEIERRGALEVLRKGINDSGCKFRLVYFRPKGGLTRDTEIPSKHGPCRGIAARSHRCLRNRRLIESLPRNGYEYSGSRTFSTMGSFDTAAAAIIERILGPCFRIG